MEETMMQFRMAILAVLIGGVGFTGKTANAAGPSDAALGKRLYLRCVACHAVSAKAPPKVGPNLQAIVGRKAASVSGFSYSAAMKNSKFVWNEATLDKWLQRPQAVVPGTTMAFAGLSNPADRKALIQYLKKPVP